MDLQNLDLQLHDFARGSVTHSQAMRWFESLGEQERRDVLRRLVLLGLQAGLVPADGREAVERSGMRGTLTPAVLVRRDSDHVRHLMAMPTLAVRELGAAFQLLVLALAIADTRRQAEECRGACTHAWHHRPEPIRQVVDLRESAAAREDIDLREGAEARPSPFPVPVGAGAAVVDTADASHRRGRRSVTLPAHPRHALAGRRSRR